MYTVTNYKTKKALIADVEAGERVRVFQPSPFPAITDGAVVIKGPHYPEPHSWYVEATIKDSIIVTVE